MAVSSILEFLALTEAMSQKATAVNTVVGQIEKAITGELTIDCSAAVDSNTDEITIPYDNSNDLSNRDALHHMLFKLTGSPSVAYSVIHPNNEHLFFVRNLSGQDATFRTAENALPSVTLANGAIAILYCDGDGILDMSSTFGSGATSNLLMPYDFHFSMFGKQVTGSQVIGYAIAGRDVNFPADLTTSQVVVGTNPTASTVQFDVKDDGTVIGNFIVADDGTVSMSTVDNTAKSVDAGSVVTLEGPSSVDATLADVHVALVGTVAP